jgi:hypothetical protein
VEVDFVIYGESGLYAFEVKNSAQVGPSDIKGLKIFAEDYPEAKCHFLYRGKDRLTLDGVLCVPCEEFLKSVTPNHL